MLSSSDDNLEFEYPQLDIQQSQIRLLVVDAVDTDNLIRCSLQSISLDSQPDYIALSYAWGSDSATGTIQVNGRAFRIRPNLHDFLATVAVEKLVGKALFIDAICINQADVAECESQIELMRQIYSGASRVIAWLGKLQLFADAPISVEKARILEVCEDIEHRSMQLHKDWFKLNEADRNSELKELERMDNGVRYLQYAATYKVPYWSGLWIVQEIILAKNLTIQVGKHEIDPEKYIAGIVSNVPASYRDVDSMTIGQSLLEEGVLKSEIRLHDLITRRSSWRERINHGPPIKLFELLIRFSQQRSTNPLDQVFGLLGLAESRIHRITVLQSASCLSMSLLKEYTICTLAMPVIQQTHHGCFIRHA